MQLHYDSEYYTHEEFWIVNKAFLMTVSKAARIRRVYEFKDGS